MSVSIDGSNGITVNGTKVATTLPAFRASNTSQQNFTANTWTKVSLGTEAFDPTSAFDSTTNFRFQPTVPGYYQVQGNIIFQSGSISITFVSSYILKNGSMASNGTYLGLVAVSAANASTTDLIYLNGTTDYVELFGYCTGTAPYVSSSNASFSAFLVRAA